LADRDELEGLLPGEDLGAPIQELKDLEVEASPRLMQRVLGSLRRRQLSAHLLTFSWSVLAAVAVEFLTMIHSLFGSTRDEPGDGN
jgi:hypothetical protein